jgi:hypothetical protein
MRKTEVERRISRQAGKMQFSGTTGTDLQRTQYRLFSRQGLWNMAVNHWNDLLLHLSIACLCPCHYLE